MKKSILLIGSGRFVEQTIIPALICLNKEFNIVGILNKSGQVSDTIKNLLPNLKVSDTIKAFEEDHIDIVFVSIPVKSVQNTLSLLLKNHLSNITLFVTTPVVPLNKLNLTSKLKLFKNAYAFEFVPFLSNYRLARTLIKDDKIGDFRKLWLNHNGYLYHGLATIRSFVNWRFPVRVNCFKFGQFSEYQFKFSKRCFASIKEPKDYTNGSFLIAGNRGTISDYALDSSNNYHISHQVDSQGKISSFNINHIPQPKTYVEQKVFEALPLDLLSDNSHIRQMNIIAAAEVFYAEFVNDTSKLYSYQNTLVEYLLIRIAKKLRVYIDPFAFFGGSILKIFIRK